MDSSTSTACDFSAISFVLCDSSFSFSNKLFSSSNSFVNVSLFSQRGVLSFEFEGDPQLLEVLLFRTDEFKGCVAESEVQMKIFACVVSLVW